MKISSRLAQLGNRRDPATGAVSVPIYHATTYAHPGLGESTGYDYTRTANPTRSVLEQAIADLEGGVSGFAFSSGMAAVSCALSLVAPGDHMVASSDLYGGTYRLLEQIIRRLGIDITYVDTGDLTAVQNAFTERTTCIFLETPTNPTMRITDIAACVALAHTHGALAMVDNTFMTPYLQRPLELGADLVVHSGTKYLGGHNDVLCGLIAVREQELAQRVYFLQNSIGATLGPQDSWLMIRGLKTLSLRMEKHEENAAQIARFLCDHPAVETVYYPGLPDAPGRDVQSKQASGFGGMVSFTVRDSAMVAPLLASVRLITFAESLGGLESLITFPARQTHADIPKEVRDATGVTDCLLRLSVGVEDVIDLMEDLAQALAQASDVAKHSNM